MGVEFVVRFPAGPPDWPGVSGKLSEVREPVVIRMIDGLPAFPDEVPEPGWAELRLGMAGGMVTVRRTAAEYRVTVWGSPAPDLARSRDAVCWAAAAAGGGVVGAPDATPQDADTFRRARLGVADGG